MPQIQGGAGSEKLVPQGAKKDVAARVQKSSSQMLVICDIADQIPTQLISQLGERGIQIEVIKPTEIQRFKGRKDIAAVISVPVLEKESGFEVLEHMRALVGKRKPMFIYTREGHSPSLIEQAMRFCIPLVGNMQDIIALAGLGKPDTATAH